MTPDPYHRGEKILLDRKTAGDIENVLAIITETAECSAFRMTVLVEMIQPGHEKMKIISEDRVNTNVYWLYRRLENN